MKTGNVLLKALVIGGVIVSTANFSNEVLAATPANLPPAVKGRLNALSGISLRNEITSMLRVSSDQQRESVALAIVAQLAAKPGISRDDLRMALKAAVAAVPGRAAAIAVAAAQAAVSGNSADQTALVLAIAMGAAEGAPTELVGIRDALFLAVPSIDRTLIERAMLPPDNQPGGNPGQNNNPTDTTPSTT